MLNKSSLITQCQFPFSEKKIWLKLSFRETDYRQKKFGLEIFRHIKFISFSQFVAFIEFKVKPA
jgi:hypothetical protein